MWRRAAPQGGSRSSAGLVEQLVAELVLQLDQADRALLGVASLLTDTTKEEGDPWHEVAALAGDQQVVVVLAAVLLEERGEVQQRPGQRVAQHEHQRDHQSSDATVAVEERMDHLELVVRDRQLHEQWEVGLVEELLQVAERVAHVVGWRRHKDGIVERGTPEPHRAPA